MKLLKFDTLKDMVSKKYLLYAIGEILLIVVGILLALYINNRNQHQQYKSQIDNTIVRVYDELEQNIEEVKKTIYELRYKDSLIYLVMNDSLKPEDFYENINLCYLIVSNHQYTLDDKAFQNLMQLNVSDNRYNDELLNDLKALYAINNSIVTLNDRMGDFISESSIPFLAENIESFGDLTYRRQVKDDAVNFLMNSTEYKSYVSQYAITAIRNQLMHNRSFYKQAIHVYNKISQKYNLENKYPSPVDQSIASQYVGTYVYDYKTHIDTLKIKFENDSLQIYRGDDTGTFLIPLAKNYFYIDGKSQIRSFVSFFDSNNDSTNLEMNVHLMSDRLEFIKIEGN